MKKIPGLIILGIFMANFAYAIPAFARKYGFSCSVCHAPFPHLKDFGEEFAANGFVIENEPKRAKKKTGDKTLLLQRELPIAIRMDLYATYESSTDNNPDVKAPYVLKFLSGGNISKNISYYMYFLLTERGEIAGLEDAYISFNNLFGIPLSVVFGQFRVSDPVKPSELRLTFENYMIYKFRIGFSDIRLSYERGLMFLYSTRFGTDLSFEVLNGNGLQHGMFDKDKYKNFAGRIAQSYRNLTLGFMGYWGREGTDSVNEVTFIGPDLTFRAGNIQLFFQYLRRRDTNPLFQLAAQSVNTDAYMGELMFSPRGENGKLFFTLLYNNINSDYDLADYSTISFNLNYLIRRNLKLIMEYTRDLNGDTYNRFVAGFVTAF